MRLLVALLTVVFMASCSVNGEVGRREADLNKGTILVKDLMRKVGGYELLRKKVDVKYTYVYETPDGKKDISSEIYLFDGELSYGKYTLHERTLSNLDGVMEQGWNGKKYWLKSDGEILNNEEAMKRVIFNRHTNYYWFTMFQKLLDPGVKHEYLGDTTVNEVLYEIVNITFESEQETDTYRLYVNQNTGLVDMFLFTVVDFGMNEPLLMVIEYEKIEGLMLPTNRKYKKSDWKLKIDEQPWVKVNWTDIKFSNGLTKDIFNS